MRQSGNPFVLSPEIALEYCGRDRRTMPLLAMMASYALGSVTLPWMTKMLPSWHYLLAMATVPNLIVILGYRCEGKCERVNGLFGRVGT